jgi:hypothetical protein
MVQRLRNVSLSGQDEILSIKISLFEKMTFKQRFERGKRGI